MLRGEDGKMKIAPKKTATGLDGWVPICEKNLPFEATASFLLLASKPGVPHAIKLQEQHRALFPLDKPIGRDSGRKIAEWASGVKPSLEAVKAAYAAATTPEAIADADASAALLTANEKGAAREARKTRIVALKTPAQPPSAVLAQVAHEI